MSEVSNVVKVRINGQEIPEVVGANYLHEFNKFRVIVRRNEKLKNYDFDIDEVIIDIKGKKANYNKPVICVFQSSRDEFIEAKGRFKCLEVTDDGIVRIVDEGGKKWTKLQIDVEDVPRVREMVRKGKGSLYVEISRPGLGRIGGCQIWLL